MAGRGRTMWAWGRFMGAVGANGATTGSYVCEREGAGRIAE